MVAKSPPEPNRLPVHGQRVTAGLSGARRIPSCAKGRSDKRYPGASVADLPGCVDLRCKSSGLEINSVHRRNCFNITGPVRSRVVLTEWRAALPAPGMLQLEPLFTQLSASSTLRLSTCCSSPKVRRWGKAAASPWTFPETCLEPGKPKSSEQGCFLSFPTPQNPFGKWGDWYLCGQVENLPKKRKSGGEAQKERKEMSTGETFHSVLK